MLVLHSSEVDDIELGQGDHNHCVEVFHVGEATFVCIVLHEGSFTA